MTATGAQEVSLDGLTKRFGSVVALEALSMTVAPGEFLVLLGPSGCGKTTALRMVAGLETVSDGTIRIGGREVTHVLPKYRDIAMVFQSYALYPHKTVAENIGYPLLLRKIPAAERDAAVRQVAAQVHLTDYLDRLPRQLSGGQRQRVALARAIIRRPAVFLMDEPLSNLDAKLRVHMRGELKHMQHELGITTIYVTHDQVEAMTLAHRVAILDRGRLQQLGKPREIYEDPANLFVAGFVGSPPMSFADGSLTNGRFTGPGIDLEVGNVPDVGTAVLGLRAEDCQVVAAGDGQISATVYSTELIGDHTLVQCQVSGGAAPTMVVVKMDKAFEAAIDTKVDIAVTPGAPFLFDQADGARVRVVK